MVMLTFTQFLASMPAVHKRLLNDSASQNAVNSQMQDGKVSPLRKPKRVGVSNSNPPESIYLQRVGGWLDWPTDVDVIRSPLQSEGLNDTLIYTGSGRPQIRAEGSTSHYDLGLPAPISAPVASAQAAAQGGDIANIERIIFGTYVSPTEEDKNVYQGIGAAEKTLTFAVAQDQVVNIHVKLKMTYVQALTGAVSVPIGLLVFRDPQNIPAIFAAATAGTTLPEQPIEQRSYNVSFGSGSSGNDNVDLVNSIDDFFLDTPSAASHTYLIVWRNEVYLQYAALRPAQPLPIAQIYGFRLNWDIEARVNNRMRITSVQDTNLVLDAQVQFSNIVGTGALPAGMNTKVFTVSDIINSKVFQISTLIEGGYTSGGQWTQFFSISTLETRNYRYTYVSTINGVDYEGPASGPSSNVDAGQGQSVLVNAFSPFPGSWNSPADRIRLYRFVATSSTTGVYQFVAEFPLSQSSYTDTILGENLGEQLPDPDRETPPETLAGIIELPNGGAAAFSGKTVYLAEPNFLHSWPLEYARNAHDDVVAMGAFGGSLAIATKTQPYVLTGTDPTTMTMDKIELNQPCLSKRGCVDFGYAWTYPAPDGLVLLTTGRAEVITKQLFTERQWKDLNPASFVAASYENQYVCFYIDLVGNKGGFMFYPYDIAKGVVYLDFWADAVWTDQSDGKLYIAQGNLIKQFDADPVELDMRWQSKEFSTPKVTLTVGRVEANKYPLSMSVFCDGQEVSSVRINSREAFRVGAPNGTSWSVEVRGQHKVEAIFLAENMEELGKFPGGA